MIIKTKRSYSSKRFRCLIQYIESDKGRVDDGNTFTIFHNLKSTDTDEIIREFVENDIYRRKRKNGVVLYHEILSWHPDDKENITMEMLEEMALEFIQLRGKNALCFAKPHIESDNIHLHFCFSGIEYKSERTLRLDNKEFKEIRLEMERFKGHKTKCNFLK